MKNTYNILIFETVNSEYELSRYIFTNHIFKETSMSSFNLIFTSDTFTHDTDTITVIDAIIIGNNVVIDTDLFRQQFLNIPKYFIGIGQNILSESLDLGDCFFINNKTDFKSVLNRFGHDNTFYIPDIAFNLLNDTFTLKNLSSLSREQWKIGVCLPNTLSEEYIDNLVNYIKYIISENENINVYLIPYNLSSINYDIKLQLQNTKNVYFMEYTTELREIINNYSNLDIIISSNYQSIILSIITQTPFIALNLDENNDIEHLKNDMLKDSNNDILSQFIEHLFIYKDTKIKLHLIQDNYNEIVVQLQNYNRNILQQVDKSNTIIQNLVIDKYIRVSPPQYISNNDKQRILKNVVSHVLNKVQSGRKVSVNDIDYVLKGYPILNILPKTKSTSLDSYKNFITEEILFSITGDPYAPYYYGLYSNLFKTTFLEQLKWIITDYYDKYYYKQTNKNITIINKNFQKLHRSGWQYIVDNMRFNNLDTNPIIIDTYIDKTFHWNKEFYLSKNIIPYKKNWIGFIHHTYSNYNNSYNCLELFSDKTFLESLRTCKCLIIMTEYMSDKIKKSLQKLNIDDVDVITIIHPTENTDILFNWNSFINNKNKCLVQIGNWLRDVFSIYRVELPLTSIITKKCILQNNNSENYFPPPNLMESLYNEFNNNNIDSNDNRIICRNSFSNMHLKGLYNCILDMETSVEVLSYLDNDAYDSLLSKNIVFLNLIDASACNTLIECIMRNTPIIINKIPAVVELLGQDYPLYYNNYYDISKILDNTDRILAAHEYLTRVDKHNYDIDTFKNTLTETILKYSS